MAGAQLDLPSHSPIQRTDLLSRYLRLHSQQSTYRRSSSDSTTSPSRRTSRSSTSSVSPGSSPTGPSPSISSPVSPPSLPESTTTRDPSVDQSLYDINHAIKSTLTDLLNCEEVKGDEEWRKWCQARLMDAELELKRERRRRVSSVSVGGE